MFIEKILYIFLVFKQVKQINHFLIMLTNQSQFCRTCLND